MSESEVEKLRREIEALEKIPCNEVNVFRNTYTCSRTNKKWDKDLVTAEECDHCPVRPQYIAINIIPKRKRLKELEKLKR